VRRLLVILIGSAALLTSACLSVAASPDLEYATVVSVVDADTIWVELNGEQEKVRYIGIDAPETRHPIKGVEEYGHEAKSANRKLVEGKTVRLEFDVGRRDKYGRLLAYVYLEDGTFVNAWLVEHGFAQVMTVPPNVKHQDLFLNLQREPRESKRGGLWGRD
jgi:micrococcal nuclease